MSSHAMRCMAQLVCYIHRIACSAQTDHTDWVLN